MKISKKNSNFLGYINNFLYINMFRQYSFLPSEAKNIAFKSREDALKYLQESIDKVNACYERGKCSYCIDKDTYKRKLHNKQAEDVLLAFKLIFERLPANSMQIKNWLKLTSMYTIDPIDGRY